MKKMLVSLFVVLTVISLTGCNKKKESVDQEFLQYVRKENAEFESEQEDIVINDKTMFRSYTTIVINEDGSITDFVDYEIMDNLFRIEATMNSIEEFDNLRPDDEGVKFYMNDTEISYEQFEILANSYYDIVRNMNLDNE